MRRPIDRAFDGRFTVTEVPAAVEVRATLSGRIPFVRGLSCRFSANYATATEGPYVVGPNPLPGVTSPEAFLNPVDTFRVFYGLSYDFFTGSDAVDEGDSP